MCKKFAAIFSVVTWDSRMTSLVNNAQRVRKLYNV